MKEFELVVVWSNGEKSIYEYEAEEQAWNAGEGMKMALGTQIAWFGTRRKG